MSETFDERKKRENAETYAKWLSCGYKGDMVLNDVGWCDNKLDKTQLRKLTVIKSKQVDATVEYVQLPNGNWVAGSHLFTKVNTYYGYGCCVSIWSKQYETKGEAVVAELDRMETCIGRENKKALTPELASALAKNRNQFANASVFDAFFGAGASFEQTSLFDVA